MIAEVIVDITNSEVDKVFDYNIGDLNVTVGSRVGVPFANRKIEGLVIGIKEKSQLPECKIKFISEVLDDFPALTQESINLVNYISKKYSVSKASAIRLFLPAEMRRGRVSEKQVEFIKINPAIDLEAVYSSIRKSAKNQLAVLDFLKSGKTARASILRQEFSASAIKALLDRDALIVDKIRVNRLPYSEMISEDKSVQLTSAQNNAISSINNTNQQVTLIHGVTGSGKTEVYLQLIKEAIQKGKTAIMLVPEISLTPQMFKQLRGRFNELCAIIHSGLSAGERFDEWSRLRSGEAKIAIGARSAIFAPLENLGVIIIDEEHDGSYESESSPRYSTIDIAKKRCDYNGCKLVLGSATPSINTYMLAKEGSYNLVKMPERINKRPLPEVIVADMRDETRRGNNGFFSSYLKEELQSALDAGKQSIIFLNRRGFSQQVICRDCGYVAKCTVCDVSLNYHKSGDLLKCHYCGTNYKMLSACPDCGSVNLSLIGTGTQKIVDELKKLFPQAKIARMDNDTTRNKEGHYKILSAFSKGESDILVGTQMIAKGHDFPNVTLVGILDADMSLHFSDYRSGERTYQLLTQVAGRSGRAENKGKVVLQTYSPQNPVLKYAMAYDYEGFYEREVAIRKATKFPPFALIVRILVEATEEADAIEGLKTVYMPLKELYEHNKDAFLFFNKMKSPIKRLKNKYRYQILMRLTDNNDAIREEIYKIVTSAELVKATASVEENPANLS